MPRFLPEYRELDTRSTGEKVVLTIGLIILFLFMPTTVLGYFAEKTIPGQPLYPMKRGIEAVILAVESISPYSKSLYYQRLAQTRVDETSTLIAEAAETGDTAQLATQTDVTLTDAYVSLQQATVSIQNISDPTQKQQALQQLTTSIQNYQTQLSHLSSTLGKNTTSSTSTPPVLQAEPFGTPPPTPTPDPTTILQNQIMQTQNNLQNLTSNLQTVLPTPSVTPLPMSPTPQPLRPTQPPWWLLNQHRNQQTEQRGDN